MKTNVTKYDMWPSEINLNRFSSKKCNYYDQRNLVSKCTNSSLSRRFNRGILLPLSPFPSHTPTAKASAHFSIVALNLWPPSTATALVHIFTYRSYHGPWNTDGSTYEICTESAHLVPNIFSNFSLPNSNFTSYAISSWSGNFFLAQPAHLSSSSLFSFHSKRFLLQLQVCSKKKG